MSDYLDRKVAEHVLGWVFKPKHELPKGVYCLSGGKTFFQTPGNDGWTCVRCYGIPEFTSTPERDYEVLRHVRRNWSRKQQLAFSHQLMLMWDKKGFDEWPWMGYEPGDYARSALKALGEDA